LGRTGPTDQYVTTLSNVTGLKFGTKVLFEGYPVGQIEEITPNRDNGAPADPRDRYKVTFSVEKGWPVPADSRAVVTASGLLSAIIIDIHAGESTTLAEPGDKITGRAGANMFAVMADVAGEIDTLSKDGLMPLIKQISKMIEPISAATSTEVPEMLANLTALSAALNKDVPAALEAVRKVTERLETEVLSDKNTENISSSLDDMATFASSLGELGSNLGDTERQVNKLIRDLDSLIERNGGHVDDSMVNLRYTLDSVARRIDGITHNLEGTARNMAEFSRAIRQNPGLLLRGGSPTDEARREPRR
ncbi:MAG: MlaD family protein, partial [Rhodospirillaceae bacterium]